MVNSRAGLNPFDEAVFKLRYRDYDGCTHVCSQLLVQNPRDEAVFSLKARVMVNRRYCEFGDEGIGDMVMDEHQTVSAPRPGRFLILSITIR